jgi:hypothetical protein
LDDEKKFMRKARGRFSWKRTVEMVLISFSDYYRCNTNAYMGFVVCYYYKS